MKEDLISLLKLAMDLDRKLTVALNMGQDTTNLYELIKANNAAIEKAERRRR